MTLLDIDKGNEIYRVVIKAKNVTKIKYYKIYGEIINFVFFKRKLMKVY